MLTALIGVFILLWSAAGYGTLIFLEWTNAPVPTSSAVYFLILILFGPGVWLWLAWVWLTELILFAERKLRRGY